MHTGFVALWLPIVLSAVLVFAASSVLHMFTKWHAGDWNGVPDEAAARKAIGALNLPPGDYMMPRPGGMEEMNSPEFAAKKTEGPNLVMTIFPNGPVSMGAALRNWFIFSLVVSAFTGYVAAHALPLNAPYLSVFRIVGAVAFASYGLASVPQSIWYGRNWGTTLRGLGDALLYGALTAGAFGWRWPHFI